MPIPVLRQILDALGPSPLRVLSPSAGLDIPVADVIIYEPRTLVPPARHAMLLAVGISPAAAEETGLAQQAWDAGHSCLVVKSYGEPLDGLASTAEKAGITLLAADDAMAWRHLDTLISSVLTATSRSAREDRTAPVGDLSRSPTRSRPRPAGRRPWRTWSSGSWPIPPCPARSSTRSAAKAFSASRFPTRQSTTRSTGSCPERRAFAGSRPPAPTPCPGSRRASTRAVRCSAPSGWLTPPANSESTPSRRCRRRLTLPHCTCWRPARPPTWPGGSKPICYGGSLPTRPVPRSWLRMGLSQDVAVAVAAFIVATGDPEGMMMAQATTRLADLVNQYCGASLGGYGCALVEGTVYALLPASPSRQSHRKLVVDIVQRAQATLHVPVRAGLGSIAAGLRFAASSRQDADLVLRVLAEQPIDPGQPVVATIDEVRATAALVALGQLLTGDARLTQGTGSAIAAFDLEHGTDYARTLLAYLSATARSPRPLAISTCTKTPADTG